MALQDYVNQYEAAAEKYNFPVMWFANLAGTESMHQNIPAHDEAETAHGVFQQNNGWFDTFASQYGYTGDRKMFNDDPDAQIDTAGRWWGERWNALKQRHPDVPDSEIAQALAYSWNTNTSRLVEDLLPAYHAKKDPHAASGVAHNAAYNKNMVTTLRKFGGDSTKVGTGAGAGRTGYYPTTAGYGEPVSGERISGGGASADQSADQRLAPALGNARALAEKLPTRLTAYVGSEKAQGEGAWLTGDTTGAKTARALGIMGAASMLRFLTEGGGPKQRYGGAMASGGKVIDPYATAMAYRQRGGRF